MSKIVTLIRQLILSAPHKNREPSMSEGQELILHLHINITAKVQRPKVTIISQITQIVSNCQNMLISITLSQSFIYITVYSAGNHRPISDQLSNAYGQWKFCKSQTSVSIKYTGSQGQENYLESLFSQAIWDFNARLVTLFQLDCLSVVKIHIVKKYYENACYFI